jgi:hypothetical protein
LVEDDFLTVIAARSGILAQCLGWPGTVLAGDNAARAAAQVAAGPQPALLRFSAGEAGFVDPTSVATAYRRGVARRPLR